GDGARNVAQSCAQRRGTPAVEPGPLRRHVLVEVRDGTSAQSERIVFGVFRRANQTPFLSVPGREHDRAPRTRTSLDLFSNGSRGFEDTNGSADIVGGARTPSVAVPADEHQL